MSSIIELLLQIEKSGYEYFSKLAQKCDFNAGVKSILEMLAHSQQDQITRLEACRGLSAQATAEPDFYERAKVIFQGLQAGTAEFSCSIDHLALYEHAKQVQEETLQNYQKALESVDDDALLPVLEDLTEQKEKQIILLDNIIELILRPEQWVESPEFTKLDDY